MLDQVYVDGGSREERAQQGSRTRNEMNHPPDSI
jgi:hypothetical protein